MFQFNKNMMFVGVAVLAIIITGSLLFSHTKTESPFSLFNLSLSGASAQATAKYAIDYINKNLLQADQFATLDSFSDESGLVKIKITVGGKSYNSYVTKDRKFLFPQDPISMDAQVNAQQAQNNNQPKTPPTLAKVDNTMLEAYVVSRCPYGLQMQRAMDNAIANIPSLAEHIKVRYMGSVMDGKIYSMHDVDPLSNKQTPNGTEGMENLRQICVREEQPAKYWPYVSCYMKEGNSTSCQESEKVDTTKLQTCMSTSDRGLAYAKEDFDLMAKLNGTPECKANPNACAVSGSPTLILNGTKVSEFDFGGRNSNAIKTLICNSSTSASDFCSKSLNTEQAASAFSLTYAGTGSSANNAANCAPAQ